MDWTHFEQSGQMLAQYGPLLLSGFGVTIAAWTVGTVFGAALGLVIALMQRYGPTWLRWLLQGYIEIIRGTPFLVQLFFLYYGGGQLLQHLGGRQLARQFDPVTAGLIGLVIYGSPYFAEIFRSAFRAVPLGQIEAARAIGMAEGAIVRRILLPVGLVSALPALVNFSIILTKETVILSMITVPELMYRTQYIATSTFSYFVPTLSLALFFWAFVECISRVGRRLETRITKHLGERA